MSWRIRCPPVGMMESRPVGVFQSRYSCQHGNTKNPQPEQRLGQPPLVALWCLRSPIGVDARLCGHPASSHFSEMPSSPESRLSTRINTPPPLFRGPEKGGTQVIDTCQLTCVLSSSPGAAF